MGLFDFVSDITGKTAGETARRDVREDRTASLGELTPENFKKFMEMFMKMGTAQMNPLMQNAMGKVGSMMGKSGGSQTGVAQQLKAGIPGQFAQGVYKNAMGATQDLISKRSGVYSNIPMAPPAPSATKGLFDLGLQYFTGGKMQGL